MKEYKGKSHRFSPSGLRTTLLLASLALMVTLSACGEAKPYKPESGGAATASPTPTATPAATKTPGPTAAATATPAPSVAPTATATPAASVAPSVAPTVSPTPKPVTATPAPTPAAPPVATVEPKPSATVSATPPPTVTEPVTASNAQAETLYKASCIACHGDQLQGKVGPSLQKVGARKTKEQIVTQISKGSSKMPGFAESLSQSEVDALAAWLADKK